MSYFSFCKVSRYFAQNWSSFIFTTSCILLANSLISLLIVSSFHNFIISTVTAIFFLSSLSLLIAGKPVLGESDLGCLMIGGDGMSASTSLSVLIHAFLCGVGLKFFLRHYDCFYSFYMRCKIPQSKWRGQIYSQQFTS